MAVTDGVNKCDTDFSERLRLAVGSRSAYSVAKSLDVSSSAVEKWLKGTSEPGRSNLVALATELDVSLQWLATGEGHMRPEKPPSSAQVSAPSAVPAVPVDAHLLGRLTDGIVKLYKEMGQGIALHQAVEKAVELHDEIVSVTDPDDDGGRAGAMAVILARLRKELRSAAANPSETKRLA